MVTVNTVEAFEELLTSPDCPDELVFNPKNTILTDKHVPSIVVALLSEHRPSKLTLKFSNRDSQGGANCVTGAGLRQIVAALCTGKRFEQLTIDFAHPLEFHGEEGGEFAGLLAADVRPQSLTLDLTDCRIYIDSIAKIATALQSSNTGIVVLNLSHTSPFFKKTTALTDALQSGECPPYLTLILRSMHIQLYEGLDKIVQALLSGRGPRYLTLDLQWNQLNDEDIKKLASAFDPATCPVGLTVILAKDPTPPFLGDFDITIKTGQIITDALLKNGVPLGLSIKMGEELETQTKEYILEQGKLLPDALTVYKALAVFGEDTQKQCVALSGAYDSAIFALNDAPANVDTMKKLDYIAKALEEAAGHLKNGIGADRVAMTWQALGLFYAELASKHKGSSFYWECQDKKYLYLRQGVELTQDPIQKKSMINFYNSVLEEDKERIKNQKGQTKMPSSTKSSLRYSKKIRAVDDMTIVSSQNTLRKMPFKEALF